MDTKVKLKVKGVIDNQVQTGGYALVLVEADGKRELPIIIGTAEAQAILIAVENIDPPRPLTHDLFPVLFKELDVTVTEVYIHKYEDGVFFSEMRLEVGKGRKKRSLVIDIRTSDAIAIALRMKRDIFVCSSIIDNKGITLGEHETDGTVFYDSANHDGKVDLRYNSDDYDGDDDDDDEDDSAFCDFDEEDKDRLMSLMDSLIGKNLSPAQRPIADQSMDSLNRNLTKCIKSEDYERAQLYRDEILRRGGEPDPNKEDEDYPCPF